MWLFLQISVPLFVAVLGAAFLVRFQLYRKESRQFLTGARGVEPRFHIHVHHHAIIDDGSSLSSISQRIEQVLKDSNMAYVHRDDAWCGLSSFLSNLPIKCVICIDHQSSDAPSVSFDFYDYYLQPVMIPYMRRKFGERIASLLNMFGKEFGFVFGEGSW